MVVLSYADAANDVVDCVVPVVEAGAARADERVLAGAEARLLVAMSERRSADGTQSGDVAVHDDFEHVSR